ncbi:MAG: DUF481 domain-containing protein [Myxococcota bacterium]
MNAATHLASAGAAAILFLVAATADAQTVNAEALQRNEYTPGWSGNLTGSFAFWRGNVDYLDVGGSGSVQYQTLYPHDEDDPVPYVRQRGFLAANGRFAQRNDTTFLSNSFVHARWTGMWHPIVGSDVFAQFQFNEFLRLNRRILTGAGLRIEALHLPEVVAAFGSTYMLEIERVDAEAAAPDDAETTAHRWSSYGVMRSTLFDERLLLQATIYVQPRFDDFTDHRVLTQFEGEATVTEVLSLGTQVMQMFDSRPPNGVTRLDLRVLNTLKLTLR